MEPVRGGKLVFLDSKHNERLKNLRPNATSVEWAFRFLQAIPNVTMTLSGMSDFNQLTENISIHNSFAPLNEDEIAELLDIAKEMTSKNTLPCTACRYCTTNCPMQLNIPSLIELYNDYVYSEGGFLAPMAINALPDDKKPSACINCRACEAVCPQNIKISEMMNDFTNKLHKGDK